MIRACLWQILKHSKTMSERASAHFVVKNWNGMMGVWVMRHTGVIAVNLRRIILESIWMRHRVRKGPLMWFLLLWKSVAPPDLFLIGD